MVDTALTRHCLLVRSVNLAQPDFQLSAFPLTELETKEAEEDASSNAKRRRLEGAPVSVGLAPVADCVRYELGVTPSKVLNFTRGELRVIDFLCSKSQEQ